MNREMCPHVQKENATTAPAIPHDAYNAVHGPTFNNQTNEKKKTEEN